MRIIDALGAVLELSATEIREATTLVEAVAAEEFQTELRSLTDSEESRQKVREAALELVKCGISGWDEVEKMVRFYRIAQLFDLDESDVRAIGQVKNRHLALGY